MNRLLVPIALILIAIATFYWWTDPHYENIKVLSAELNQSKEALATVEQLEILRIKLNAIKDTFKEEDLLKLQKFLPDNVDNIRLFLDIQGVAARNGIAIKDISAFDQGQKTTTSGAQAIGPSGKQYSQMVLSFSVGVSYEGLKVFLKDLEKSLRLVEIKSIGFSADDKTPDLYKVSININTFWLSSKK